MKETPLTKRVKEHIARLNELGLETIAFDLELILGDAFEFWDEKKRLSAENSRMRTALTNIQENVTKRGYIKRMCSQGLSTQQRTDGEGGLLCERPLGHAMSSEDFSNTNWETASTRLEEENEKLKDDEQAFWEQ